jgi:3-oxoacyl-[acyl-carrier protein] reductase
MDFKNKVAVVTGSGGPGSGRAEVLLLAAKGCRVVVSDVNDVGGEETLRLIIDAGGTARFFHCDVCIQSQVEALVAFAERTYGGLDVLVNNASGPGYRPGARIEESYDTIQTDLFGALYGLQYGIAAMKRRGGGVIVNVSSTSALGHGSDHSNMPAYDVAKIAVLRLATTHAALRNSHNIRINCLVPDWVATPDVKSYWDALTPDERRNPRIPPSLTTLDEIAHAALRLITDESLAGRALIYWSRRGPTLLSADDPGFAGLDPYTL